MYKSKQNTYRMKIYSVDFEKVVKSYKTYVENMLDLDQQKLQHQTEMDVYKKDMEAIIASANSGLIVDEATQKANIQKFKEIQIEASQKDGEFRNKFTEDQNTAMESAFEEVSELINSYAKSRDVDMIVSKSTLVFVKDDLDITDIIIDVLKEKNLCYETKKES